jgi:hypothetical protein
MRMQTARYSAPSSAVDAPIPLLGCFFADVRLPDRHGVAHALHHEEYSRIAQVRAGVGFGLSRLLYTGHNQEFMRGIICWSILCRVVHHASGCHSQPRCTRRSCCQAHGPSRRLRTVSSTMRL